MKNAYIVHNPGAGKGTHSKREIIEAVEKKGYKVDYISTKDERAWNDFRPKEGNIFIAGGDGTVTKLAKRLLLQAPGKNVVLHIFPYGTANNIAKSLKIATENERHSAHGENKTKNFDCGKIQGCSAKPFFFESLGLGVLPELISQMKSKEQIDNPAEKLKSSLKVLLNIVKTFKAIQTTIKAGGLRIKGSFLLVELMNIHYLGPNLPLAPNAGLGNGYFELVLITEEKRSEFLNFLNELAEGKKQSQNIETFAKTIRVQNVQMECEENILHIDDTIFDDNSCRSLNVQMWHKALEFSKNNYEPK